MFKDSEYSVQYKYCGTAWWRWQRKMPAFWCRGGETIYSRSRSRSPRYRAPCPPPVRWVAQNRGLYSKALHTVLRRVLTLQRMCARGGVLRETGSQRLTMCLPIRFMRPCRPTGVWEASTYGWTLQEGAISAGRDASHMPQVAACSKRANGEAANGAWFFVWGGGRRFRRLKIFTIDHLPKIHLSSNLIDVGNVNLSFVYFTPLDSFARYLCTLIRFFFFLFVFVWNGSHGFNLPKSAPQK